MALDFSITYANTAFAPGTPSTAITLTLTGSGTLGSDATFALSDGGAGGAFYVAAAVTSVKILSGQTVGATTQFVYVPPAAQSSAVTITATCTGGLTATHSLAAMPMGAGTVIGQDNFPGSGTPPTYLAGTTPTIGGNWTASASHGADYLINGSNGVAYNTTGAEEYYIATQGTNEEMDVVCTFQNMQTTSRDGVAMFIEPATTATLYGYMLWYGDGANWTVSKRVANAYTVLTKDAVTNIPSAGSTHTLRIATRLINTLRYVFGFVDNAMLGAGGVGAPAQDSQAWSHKYTGLQPEYLSGGVAYPNTNTAHNFLSSNADFAPVFGVASMVMPTSGDKINVTLQNNSGAVTGSSGFSVYDATNGAYVPISSYSVSSPVITLNLGVKLGAGTSIQVAYSGGNVSDGTHSLANFALTSATNNSTLTQTVVAKTASTIFASGGGASAYGFTPGSAGYYYTTQVTATDLAIGVVDGGAATSVLWRLTATGNAPGSWTHETGFFGETRWLQILTSGPSSTTYQLELSTTNNTSTGGQFATALISSVDASFANASYSPLPGGSGSTFVGFNLSSSTTGVNLDGASSSQSMTAGDGSIQFRVPAGTTALAIFTAATGGGTSWAVYVDRVFANAILNVGNSYGSVSRVLCSGLDPSVAHTIRLFAGYGGAGFIGVNVIGSGGGILTSALPSYGIAIGILGDSIMLGVLTNGSDAQVNTGTVGQGLAALYNTSCGVSAVAGGTIATIGTGISSLPSTAKMVNYEGGVNDAGNATPLGTFATTEAANLAAIRAQCPSATIVRNLITTYKYADVTPYNASITSVFATFHASDSNSILISPYSPTDFSVGNTWPSTYWLTSYPDGLHPNAAGDQVYLANLLTQYTLLPTAGTLSHGTVTYNSVPLSWVAAFGGQSPYTYAVNRSLSSNMSSPTLLTSGISGTTYTDSTVISSTTYYYQITVTDSLSNTGVSNILQVNVPTAAPLNPGSVSANSPYLIALIASNCTGGVSPYTYQWARRVYNTGSYVNISGATSLTITDLNVTQGTYYDYRITYTDSAASTVVAYSLHVLPAQGGGGGGSGGCVVSIAFPNV